MKNSRNINSFLKNFSLNFKKIFNKFPIFTYLGFFGIYLYLDRKRYKTFISKQMLLNSLKTKLKNRFEFSERIKIKKDKNLNKFEQCKIFPKNIIDMQTIFRISNRCNIPIVSDQNLTSKGLFSSEHLNFSHIKIDYSLFNKVLNFNKENKLITVEPGIKIKTLLNFLKDYNLTIKQLELYKNSEFTLADINYNNYHGFLNGKFFDKNIEEIKVSVPNNNEALRLKQTNDSIISSGNYRDIFLRSNSIFGIVSEFTLKTKKIKEKEDNKYLYLETPDIPFEDILEFFKSLEDLKNFSMIKDLMISKKGNENKIFLLSKERTSEEVKKIFNEKNFELNQFNSEEYKNYCLENFEICKDENIFRKLKLKIHSDLALGLKKIYKYAKELDTEISYHFEMKNNCISINVYCEDDINSIEKSLHFIRRVQSFSEKNNGNLFRNFF